MCNLPHLLKLPSVIGSSFWVTLRWCLNCLVWNTGGLDGATCLFTTTAAEQTHSYVQQAIYCIQSPGLLCFTDEKRTFPFQDEKQSLALSAGRDYIWTNKSTLWSVLQPHSVRLVSKDRIQRLLLDVLNRAKLPFPFRPSQIKQLCIKGRKLHLLCNVLTQQM